MRTDTAAAAAATTRRDATNVRSLAVCATSVLGLSTVATVVVTDDTDTNAIAFAVVYDAFCAVMTLAVIATTRSCRTRVAALASLGSVAGMFFVHYAAASAAADADHTAVRSLAWISVNGLTALSAAWDLRAQLRAVFPKPGV